MLIVTAIHVGNMGSNHHKFITALGGWSMGVRRGGQEGSLSLACPKSIFFDFFEENSIFLGVS